MSAEITADQVLKLIFGILTVLLNGILLAAMIKDRKNIFVTRISYLVANLALADLLTGLALVFVEPDNLKHEDTPQAILDYKLALVWGPMLVSFLTIFIMSLDRLIVIVLPTSWTKILTVPRTICCLLLVWVCAISAAAAIQHEKNKTQFALTIIYEVCALFFIVIHLYILYVLRKRKQHLIQSESAGESTFMECSESPSSHVNIAVHAKVTTVVAILLAVLVITFFPHFICLQIFTASNVYNLEPNINYAAYDPALLYTDAFSYLNFVVNPIIYAWRLRMYRRAIKGLLSCVTG